MKVFEVIRTFFIIFSVTMIMQVLPALTRTELIVIISLTIAGTGVSIALMSKLGIRDKDVLKCPNY